MTLVMFYWLENTVRINDFLESLHIYTNYWQDCLRVMQTLREDALGSLFQFATLRHLHLPRKGFLMIEILKRRTVFIILMKI